VIIDAHAHIWSADTRAYPFAPHGLPFIDPAHFSAIPGGNAARIYRLTLELST